MSQSPPPPPPLLIYSHRYLVHDHEGIKDDVSHEDDDPGYCILGGAYIYCQCVSVFYSEFTFFFHFYTPVHAIAQSFQQQEIR